MFGLRSGTVRTRFTTLYAVTFLLSGIALLGLTILFSSASRTSNPRARDPPTATGAPSASRTSSGPSTPNHTR